MAKLLILKKLMTLKLIKILKLRCRLLFRGRVLRVKSPIRCSRVIIVLVRRLTLMQMAFILVFRRLFLLTVISANRRTRVTLILFVCCLIRQNEVVIIGTVIMSGSRNSLLKMSPWLTLIIMRSGPRARAKRRFSSLGKLLRT